VAVIKIQGTSDEQAALMRCLFCINAPDDELSGQCLTLILINAIVFMQTFTQFPLKGVPSSVVFSRAENLREENSGFPANNTLKIEPIFTSKTNTLVISPYPCKR
jgi:hypothetical protein